jgi:hypothetical protein
LLTKGKQAFLGFLFFNNEESGWLLTIGQRFESFRMRQPSGAFMPLPHVGLAVLVDCSGWTAEGFQGSAFFCSCGFRGFVLWRDFLSCGMNFTSVVRLHT